MQRRAFTLIELLVVIGIMITLMSLIMAGVMLAKRTAMRAKAVSQLGAVASAIDQYRSLNNSYPESWTVPVTPPVEWTAAFNAAGISPPPSSGTEVYGSVFVKIVGPPIEYKGAQNISNDAWKVINVQLAYQLASLITDNIKDGQLIDPWKTPLRYRPSKFYPCTVADTAFPRADRMTPPGQDSYQLWSAGPNGTDDLTNPGEGSDDIPQWVKQ